MRFPGLIFAVVSLTREDIPPALRNLLPADLTAYLGDVERSSAERLREGEMDHMVYYVLQSNSFTKHPPVEPALCATTLVKKRNMPPAAAARIDDFLRASVDDARFRYLRSLVHSREEVQREYSRAMLFLYEKEIASQSRQGEERRQFIAGLYQKRGHSSDTSPDANSGLQVGLDVARELRPEWKVRRALVIGPGLDFAPRTALRQDQPQSYQPFALADLLVRSKLAPKDSLDVQCVDLNPRVVEYFAGKPIRATRLNVLTSRLDESFDLIVATNVLLYFDNRELLLALTNIKAMLNARGLFLHNDTRREIEAYGSELGIPVRNARMVRLSDKRELYDAIVLHWGN